MNASFEHIRYAVDDGIATLTLHRPERLNAVNSAMLREIVGALDAADADDAVRVVIVTGAGRAFCAGADLAAGGRTFDVSSRAPGNPAAGERWGSRSHVGAPSPSVEHEDGGGIVTLRVFDMSKPVIAAINGAAVGFGVTFTLPMDVRLAAANARLGFVFARRGVVPEACSTWFLPRLVGIARAAEWVYTGRVFDADEALAGGLVSRVIAPDALLSTARSLALEIARNTSAVSVALSRHMLWKQLGAAHPRDAHRLDSRAMAWTGASADAVEGITAFLEKRPARFPSRVSVDMPAFFPWWTDR
jgi:enoyl-CoA hydratase/carnithine racemase